MPDLEAFRKDLFDILDGIAAGGTDFYAGLAELRCMWFDDHWTRDPHGLVQDGVISEAEHEILNRFSETFRNAYPKGTPTLCRICGNFRLIRPGYQWCRPLNKQRPNWAR